MDKWITSEGQWSPPSDQAGPGAYGLPQQLPSLPKGITVCEQCNEYAAHQGTALIHACASAGIERGMSTLAMMRSYLAAYHDRDHTNGDET
jgi:hypothetical protein